MSIIPHGSLPSLFALDRRCLQGHAIVLWSIPLTGARGKWTNASFHSVLRRHLLENAISHDVWCPAYSLLADEFQLLWTGVSTSSNQLAAIKSLRAEILPALASDRRWEFQWISNGPDDAAQEIDVVELVGEQVFQSQELAKPANESASRTFAGCMIPRYPRLDPQHPEYWSTFWRLYWNQRQRSTNTSHSIPSPLAALAC